MEILDLAFISYLDKRRRYPRSMSNNNPGNVRRSDKDFKGKIKHSDNKDKSFERFEMYWYGIYAVLAILKDYYFNEGANTIEKLILRYAKPGSLLQPYYEAVSKGSGFKTREKIIWKEPAMYLIIDEICRYEGKGRNPRITPDLFHFVWTKLNP